MFKKLGTNIVSFTFDHASEMQIGAFFKGAIAFTDGKWGIFFEAFFDQLTINRKDQLFPILLNIGQSDENMLRCLLLTLGEMVFRFNRES